MQCPFCSRENIERQKIFENVSELVLYNLYPAGKGHCLVTPKRHVSGIRELGDGEISSLFSTVRLVAEKLKRHLNPDGFNYGINEGDAAGQTVEHCHVHILPRFKGDFVKSGVFHSNELKEEEQMKRDVREFRKLFR